MTNSIVWRLWKINYCINLFMLKMWSSKYLWQRTSNGLCRPFIILSNKGNNIITNEVKQNYINIFWQKFLFIQNQIKSTIITKKIIFISKLQTNYFLSKYILTWIIVKFSKKKNQKNRTIIYILFKKILNKMCIKRCDDFRV
jgi:hypothetical protein